MAVYRGVPRARCEWCINPDADDVTDAVEPALCIDHLAEYDGFRVDEYDRIDDAERADAEWLGLYDR